MIPIYGLVTCLATCCKSYDKKIISKKVKIVVSHEMLKELADVSTRPKFKNIFSDRRMKALFSMLDNYALVVYPNQKVNICRDGKDNFLLEAALEGKADYLVTGDEDLLVLNSFYSTKILKPKDFEKILIALRI